MLDRQETARAFSRACAKTGKRMAARIAMMAITTSSSIRVNALRRLIKGKLLRFKGNTPCVASAKVGSHGAVRVFHRDKTR
jgi:hypothetical protein